MPRDSLLGTEFPNENNDIETKLFYLKEINDYIGKGKLQKIMNSDEIFEMNKYNKFIQFFRSEETDLFNHKISELGFEAAMESLMKKHRVNIDRFIERNNYFSHPKEIVREIYHTIQDPDNNRKILESLGMSESAYDFGLMKKLFKKKIFKKSGIGRGYSKTRRSLRP